MARGAKGLSRRPRFVAFDVDFVLAPRSDCQIKRRLHLHPGIRGAAEDLGEADGHLRRNRRLLIDDVVQRLARDAERFGRFGVTEAEWFQTILPHDATGVDGVLHGHGLFSFSLVVIDQLNIIGVPIIKLEMMRQLKGRC